MGEAIRTNPKSFGANSKYSLFKYDNFIQCKNFKHRNQAHLPPLTTDSLRSSYVTAWNWQEKFRFFEQVKSFQGS